MMSAHDARRPALPDHRPGAGGHRPLRDPVVRDRVRIAGILLGWRFVLGLDRARQQRDDAQGCRRFCRVGHGTRRSFWAVGWGTSCSTSPGSLPVFLRSRSCTSGRAGCRSMAACSAWSVAVILFCRKRHLDLLAVGDLIAFAGPIGLFFGRIANFVNAELFGRDDGCAVGGGVSPPADQSDATQASSTRPAWRGIVLFGAPVRSLLRHVGAHIAQGVLTGAFTRPATPPCALVRRVLTGNPTPILVFWPGGSRWGRFFRSRWS